MQIMVFYIAFVLIGDVGSYLIGKAVEQYSPGSSLVVFLACFFIVFGIAWRLAVRVTEPKKGVKAA